LDFTPDSRNRGQSLQDRYSISFPESQQSAGVFSVLRPHRREIIIDQMMQPYFADAAPGPWFLRCRR
jgi:hypothetical protein